MEKLSLRKVKITAKSVKCQSWNPNSRSSDFKSNILYTV